MQISYSSFSRKEPHSWDLSVAQRWKLTMNPNNMLDLYCCLPTTEVRSFHRMTMLKQWKRRSCSARSSRQSTTSLKVKPESTLSNAGLPKKICASFRRTSHWYNYFLSTPSMPECLSDGHRTRGKMPVTLNETQVLSETHLAASGCLF